MSARDLDLTYVAVAGGSGVHILEHIGGELLDDEPGRSKPRAFCGIELPQDASLFKVYPSGAKACTGCFKAMHASSRLPEGERSRAEEERHARAG